MNTGVGGMGLEYVFDFLSEGENRLIRTLFVYLSRIATDGFMKKYNERTFGTN